MSVPDLEQAVDLVRQVRPQWDPVLRSMLVSKEHKAKLTAYLEAVEALAVAAEHSALGGGPH